MHSARCKPSPQPPRPYATRYCGVLLSYYYSYSYSYSYSSYSYSYSYSYSSYFSYYYYYYYCDPMRAGAAACRRGTAA